MSRTSVLVLVLALCSATSGCHRTRYTNLAPLTTDRPGIRMGAPRDNPGSWQSFFVYGWSPAELVIEAGRACGGASHVQMIETRRSFVQGLIAAVAGYYINIYSPYTGAVTCDSSRTRPR